MSNTTNWGIMATGKIAHTFAKAVNAAEGATLYACASRNAKKAEDFGKLYGAGHCYGSYEERCRRPAWRLTKRQSGFVITHQPLPNPFSIYSSLYFPAPLKMRKGSFPNYCHKPLIKLLSRSRRLACYNTGSHCLPWRSSNPVRLSQSPPAGYGSGPPRFR